MPRNPDRLKRPPRPAADRDDAPGTPDPRPRADAHVTGLRMLARRELFTVQLREKLQRKGFPDDDIEEALRRLRADGSLSDRRAAAAFAHDAARLKLRGRPRTRRELSQLGVSDTDARAALEAAYGEDDEPTLVERALARRLRGPIESPAEYRRLFQGLRRQGFDADLVASALRPHVTTSGRTGDDGTDDEAV